ncbi:hypothetical protein R2R35_20835 [Anaerocolumna sp. AGMB13020]|uniref:hypothetical protein n=1 Tax=Anaerocolumna sp. AGMB13020 TaxID=3081750 RepID=UPI0029546E35|nr:hypothetical protein [Anaerocolumna sp. AGMB13020]WOO36217.1 hypothetical protein R2R35_20835 [Anaerocolumna sp. AGMB13020]
MGIDKAIEMYETQYGCLTGITTPDYYKNGKLMECSFEAKNILHTPYGDFIPQYTNEGTRKKYIKSLSFYENGNLRRLALEEQTLIHTTAGEIQAELVTFYDSGEIKRIFPLNGKITGFWTEENEYGLAQPITLKMDQGYVEKKFISLHYYRNGNIKSLTLWPKETMSVPAGDIKIKVRFGIAFYPEGNTKSLEPAYPLFRNTPIGKIACFDMNANGINGDMNSLNFNEDGSIKSLITSTDRIKIRNRKDNSIEIIEPYFKISLINDSEEDIVPIKIEFIDKGCILYGKNIYTYVYKDYEFEIENMAVTPKSSCSDCASCKSTCG